MAFQNLSNKAMREDMLAVVRAQVTAALPVKDADMPTIVRRTKFVHDAIQAIAPADAVELLLAGQIVATHNQIMDRLRCKGHVTDNGLCTFIDVHVLTLPPETPPLRS